MFMLGGKETNCFTMINPEVEPKKQESSMMSVDNTLEMGLFLVTKYTCVYMNMCIPMCV